MKFRGRLIGRSDCLSLVAVIIALVLLFIQITSHSLTKRAAHSLGGAARLVEVNRDYSEIASESDTLCQRIFHNKP
jgi:hypothetical protein